ncbi:hypothetical protein JTE90_023120 [Oedothorax gibbosus]|uniref:Uncharacterized protein n=1 Tax=Oedothorax gibbosus TaxID=931172 RepID=A0AAV6UP67_9ARAC|nr:hypothetical protein JTE90_023120 [Oedothorax gibbosus]
MTTSSFLYSIRPTFDVNTFTASHQQKVHVAKAKSLNGIELWIPEWDIMDVVWGSRAPKCRTTTMLMYACFVEVTRQICHIC